LNSQTRFATETLKKQPLQNDLYGSRLTQLQPPPLPMALAAQSRHRRPPSLHHKNANQLTPPNHLMVISQPLLSTKANILFVFGFI
jgi:hypothetical protein